MNRKLVAYFSATGTTAKLAANLAEAIGAELLEIKPAVAYTKADLNWMDKNSRSSIEMNNLSIRPEIDGEKLDIGLYDTVYLGFPIWWYIAPTVINTFLEQYDLSGKTIVPFATSGGSGMGKTNEKLAASCPGARLVEGRVFKRSTGKDELCAWTEQFG